MAPRFPAHPVFCALDTADAARARDLAMALTGHVGGFKIGKEFFTARGPEGVRAAVGAAALFLDLKFHDIPNTVAGAVRAACALKPSILNVHAAGGTAMMRAAAEAATAGARAAGAVRPWVVAVTVLTSLDDGDLAAVGQSGPVADLVSRLARLARSCGLGGVVCSPREIAALRAELGADFRLIVPGVRPEWAGADDQKRVMTPAEAVAAGADYLVIGRPITRAADPAEAARRIADEIAG